MPLVPPPGFADDEGAIDPRVAAALQQYASGGSALAVVAALSGTRVLIPLVANLDDSDAGPTGLEREKSAHVAVPLFQRPDGRRALLGFTSIATLTAWNENARPRPLAIRDAAEAALGEGADALLLDLAGPVRFAVETRELYRLAGGNALVLTDAGYLWVEEPPA